jgi:hypothetical protein
MQTMFTDRMTQLKAHDVVDALKQGCQSVNHYFTKLDLLFYDAGMKDDDEKIRMVARNADRCIIRQMYANPPLPIMYSNYRA